MSFEQISSILKVAGDKKCKEVQACLEGMLIQDDKYYEKIITDMPYKIILHRITITKEKDVKMSILY